MTGADLDELRVMAQLDELDRTLQAATGAADLTMLTRRLRARRARLERNLVALRAATLSV
jgi:hypothetical protein